MTDLAQRMAWWSVTALGATALIMFGAQIVSSGQSTAANAINSVEPPADRAGANSDQPHKFAPLFGTRADQSAPVEDLADGSTRLKGLFKDGTGGFAVIEKDGRAAVYGVGDTLDGVGRIDVIGTQGVTVVGQQGRVALRFEDAPSVQPPQAAKGAAIGGLRLARIRLDDGSVGLRITAVPDTTEARALGLRRGDVITQLNDKPVRHPKAVAALAQSAHGRVDIDYLRNGTPRRLTLKGN